MFKLLKTKNLDKFSPSFSLFKNTTKLFKGFKLSNKNINSFSFIDHTSLINTFVDNSINNSLIFSDNTYILTNDEYENLTNYVLEKNIISIPVVENSKTINSFITLLLPEKETEEITSFIINLIDTLSLESNIAISNEDKKLLTETININISYNYKQGPTMSLSFVTYNLSLNKLLKNCNTNKVFSLFDISFVINNLSYKISKLENKNNNIVCEYNIEFTHIVDFYSDEIIYLFKIPILAALSNTGSGSQINFQVCSVNSLPSTASNYIGGLKTYFFQDTIPSITETTSLGSELSKAYEITTGYPYFRKTLSLKTERNTNTININDILTEINISNTFKNKNKIEFPITGYISVDNYSKKINKAFYFQEERPSIEIIEENPEAAICPSHIKTIKSLDLCFDRSGETKSYIKTKYEGNSIISQEIMTYGFVYNALDIFSISYGSNPSSKFDPKITPNGTQASHFWKLISREKIDYKYGDYGYLLGVTITGTRLARFENGNELEDIIRERQLYYLGNSNTTLSQQEIAEQELLLWKLNLYKFQSLSINGFTEYTIHPIDGVFKSKNYIQDQYIIYYDPVAQKKVAIKDERYTPSYFASKIKTYRSSFASIPNKTIVNQDPNSQPFVMDYYSVPFLITGEEYTEETKISILKNNAISWSVSGLSGFPTYGSGSDEVPRFLEYFRRIVSCEANYKDCNNEESFSYKEGIPPEHTHKQNYKVLKYYDEIGDSNVKFETSYFYYSDTAPNISNVKDNTNFSTQTYPVYSQSSISSILSSQLTDQIRSNLGTVSFSTIYNSFINEGDIIKLNIIKDDITIETLEGIVLSKTLKINSIILNNKIYYKTICDFTMSNGLDSKSVNQASFTYAVNQYDNTNPVTILADPINFSGINGQFAIYKKSRGDF